MTRKAFLFTLFVIFVAALLSLASLFLSLPSQKKTPSAEEIWAAHRESFKGGFAERLSMANLSVGWPDRVASCQPRKDPNARWNLSCLEGLTNEVYESGNVAAIYLAGHLNVVEKGEIIDSYPFPNQEHGGSLKAILEAFFIATEGGKLSGFNISLAACAASGNGTDELACADDAAARFFGAIAGNVSFEPPPIRGAVCSPQTIGDAVDHVRFGLASSITSSPIPQVRLFRVIDAAMLSACSQPLANAISAAIEEKGTVCLGPESSKPSALKAFALDVLVGTELSSCMQERMTDMFLLMTRDTL